MEDLRQNLQRAFEIKSLSFWEHHFSKKRSFLKRTCISAGLGILGFFVLTLIYKELDFYSAGANLFVMFLILLYSEPLESIFYSLILSLLSNYFFIPPAGTLFESSEDIVRFFITFGFTMALLSIVSSLKQSLFASLIAKREAEQKKEAEKAKQVAEEAVRARDLFIAIISHELRNPLAAIRASTELIQKTTPDLEKMPILTKTLKNIDISSRRMTRLVSDLLDISILEANRFSVKPTKVNLKRILASIFGTFALAAREKSLQFDYRISPNCPIEIDCDQDRIVQALSNLVSNAIKFTAKGSVRLNVDSTENEIYFQVIDTGTGISSKHMQKIFDRFWQSKDAAYQGTGLGLSISKGIAEAHNGKIQVVSEVGKGSSFSLVLPLRVERKIKNVA